LFFQDFYPKTGDHFSEILLRATRRSHGITRRARPIGATRAPSPRERFAWFDCVGARRARQGWLWRATARAAVGLDPPAKRRWNGGRSATLSHGLGVPRANRSFVRRRSRHSSRSGAFQVTRGGRRVAPLGL